jgi:hypothetical protein
VNVQDDRPPGDRADRLTPFLERIARLSIDDLAVLALPEPDPDERAVLLGRAEAAARRAGRLDEVRAAPGRGRDAVVRAFAFRAYDPTWFGLNWGRSLGRADDRARLLAAVEDAAVASVVADLLPEEDVAALAEPFELAASMTGAAPAANPRLEGSIGRRGLVTAAFIASAVAIGTFSGGIIALAALAARRRPPERRR